MRAGRIRTRFGGQRGTSTVAALVSTLCAIMISSMLVGVPSASVGTQATLPLAQPSSTSVESEGVLNVQEEAPSPVPPTQQEEGNSAESQEDSANVAPAATSEEQETTLEATLASTDGHVYTVRVAYDEKANVPGNAELHVVELNQIPSDWDDEEKQRTDYKDRPAATELLLSAEESAARTDAMALALKLGNNGRFVWNKFLSIALVADGEEVVPAQDLEVEVEVEALRPEESDALEVVRLNGQDSVLLDARNTTGTGDGEGSEVPVTRVSFNTGQLGEFALAQVVERKFAWSLYGDQISVYGARSVQAQAHEAPFDMEYLDGMRLVELFGVDVEPTHAFGTTLWAEASAAEGAERDLGGVRGYALADGTARLLFGAEGTSGLVPFLASDLVALAWDSGLHTTIVSDGDVTVAGEMPRGASVSATDVTDSFAGASALDAALVQDAQTIAAFDLSLSVDGDPWTPNDQSPLRVEVEEPAIDPTNQASAYEVLRVAQDGTAKQVASRASVGSIAFDATEAGTYAVVSLRAEGEQEQTYTITWKSGDATLKEEQVAAGTRPTYAGEEPTKEQDAQYTYAFSGWEPEITDDTKVTENVTYTAQFSKVLRTYTITWKNWDNTTLEVDSEVPYGETPSYDGETPTKAGDASATEYTFSGWDPVVATVTGNATYTARFDSAALELLARDDRTQAPIEGATFTITNASGQEVWSGKTGVDGRAVVYEVATETAGGQGVRFIENATYTVRQTSTDDAHFCPQGSWVLTIGADGKPQKMQAVKGSDDDLSTLETGDRAGDIRFYVNNRKSASITYDYNYPQELKATEPASVTTKLDFLSFAQDYTVGVQDQQDPDLSAHGYEFVGWVDGNGDAWKTGDVVKLNTINNTSHKMVATWRVPLKTTVWQYAEGKTGNATAVGGQAITFATAEKSRNYADLANLGKDFAQEGYNEEARSVTEGEAYGFAFASITNAEKGVSDPTSDAATRIKALRYDPTAHRWEYQAQGSNAWSTLSLGDVLNLYYASNAMKVVWVKEDGGSFENPVLKEETLYLGSDKWYTADDLFSQVFPESSNARAESVVWGSSYFQYFGLGTDGAQGAQELAKSGLSDFQLRNTESGFVFRTKSKGDGDPAPNTLYLVYSDQLPEGSVRLSIENNTAHPYPIKELLVASEDVLSAHRAILQTSEGTRLFDGAAGEGWTEGLHAATSVPAASTVQLVLLDAAEKSFVLDGGFEGTDAEQASYKVSVGVATGSNNEILRKVLYRQSTVGNELVETKGTTRGTLDARDGCSYVIFDDSLDATLAVRKAWSSDVNPTNYRVDVALYEIWPTDAGALPQEIPLSSQESETTVAQELRSAGYRVMRSLNTQNNGRFRITKDTKAADAGWGYEFSDLPTGHAFFVVEEAVLQGSVEQLGRFERSYQVLTSPNEVTITNTRADNICRVWDNAKDGYVQFRTLNLAMDYIRNNDTRNVIEMIQSYIVPESDAVEIPEGANITLTTAQDIDGLTCAVVSRGFNGGDLFQVRGGGTLTLKDVTLDAKIESTYYGNDGNGGFVHVESGATLNIEPGTTLQNGRAANGSAVFAEDGGMLNFTGGRVLNNNATTSDGGAIGIGGTNTRVVLSGNVEIYNNHREGNGGQFNVYLNCDSSQVIQVGALAEGAHVGVCVPDGQTLYNEHGLPAKPFATYEDGAGSAENLNRLTNDRLGTSNPARYGYASTLEDSTYAHAVVWGETFQLTVHVQWLDAEYQATETPDGATVDLGLTGGTVTNESYRTAASVAGTGPHTFCGLARYDKDGKLCKYYVNETSVAPATYERMVFYGDRGVKASGKMVYQSEEYDNPVLYSSALDDTQEIIVSNKYKYTTFTVTKQALGVSGNLTSSFVLYRIPKYGVGSVYDLPNALRSLDATEADGQRFYSPKGGNRWVCDIEEGNQVAFHRFYDTTLGAVVPGQPERGDVKREDDTYSVFDGTSWHELGASEDSRRPDVRISYQRQDGVNGVDRVVSNYDAQSARSFNIQTTGDAPTSQKFDINEANPNNNLSSSYYYFVRETGANGNGKSISGDAQLISAYNPLYEYDALNGAAKVTNESRDVLAVEKKWTGDGARGTCEFAVYRVPGSPVDLSNASLFNEIVTKKQANKQDLGEPVLTFTLTDDDADYRRESWVHVVTTDDLRAAGISEADLSATYVARELTANGVSVEKHGTSASDASLDAVYEYAKDANLITITNQGAILCKVVDADGTEHPFRTLRAAYEYGTTRDPSIGSQDEFAIEMLRDYTIPANDTLTIASGKRVTLTTAATDGCEYVYANTTDPSATRATITRNTANKASLIRADEGSGIALQNIAFDGAGVGVNQQVSGSWYYWGSIVYAKNATVELASVDGTPNTGVYVANASASRGGAVYADGGSLQVHDATFVNCKATSGNNALDGGGALWASGNEVAVYDSTFTNCTAQRHGGAIKKSGYDGKLEVHGCAFSECEAISYGGAVLCEAKELVVDGSNKNAQTAFTDCKGSTRGALVHYIPNNSASPIEGTSTHVANCAFSNCTTNGTGNDDGGGAVNSDAESLVVRSSTFTACTSKGRGGALQHYLDARKELLKSAQIHDCTFTQCTSGSSGGGAACLGSLNITVTNSSFDECSSASSAGGALDIAHHNVDKVASISNCSFNKCQSNQGGAICIGGKSLTVTNSTFTDCKMVGNSQGGAIAMNVGGSMESMALYGCTFTRCESKNSGGAVFTQADQVTIADYAPSEGEPVHTTFAECAGNYGGGVWTRAITLTATDVQWSECTARYSGAGIYLDNASSESTNVQRNAFSSCSASSEGGGIYTKSAKVTVGDTSFSNCDAVGSYGGGIRVDRNAVAEVEVSSCTFSDCDSRNSGGAVLSNGKTLSVRGCSFEDCSMANGDGNQGGGAVAATSNAIETQTYVEACTFKNCAASSHGGALYTANRKLSVVGATDSAGRAMPTTFEGCTSNNQGGAVRHHTPSGGTNPDETKLEDCLFVECSAKYQGGAASTQGNEVTARRCSFTACVSNERSGGGLSAQSGNQGSYTKLFGCAFEDCHAYGTNYNAGSGGGAVYSASYYLLAEDDGTGSDATHTTFVNCTAKQHGGGVNHRKSEASDANKTELKNCSFTGCRSEEGGSNSSGGGLNTLARVVDLSGCSFDDCHADCWGGGMNQSNNGEYTTLTLSEVTFANCDVSVNEGGGLRSNARGAGVTSCGFTNCHAGATDNGSLGGGGISYGNDNDNGSIAIEGCTFTGCYTNEAKYGGAILHKTKGLTILNTTIDGTLDASAPESVRYNAGRGAGIYSNRGLVLVSDSTVANCSAKLAGGGFYQNQSYGQPATLSNVTFEGNSAYGEGNALDGNAGGGAIYFKAQNTLTVDGCTISNNSAAKVGAGIYFCPNSNSSFSLVLMNGTAITDNRVESTDTTSGAGVWLRDNSILVLGSPAIATDTLTVYNNRLSDGTQCNVRMCRQDFWENGQRKYRNMYNSGKNPDIVLYSDLAQVEGTTTGIIGVCTPGSPLTQFGLSDAAGHLGVEHIISDDNKMKGKIDDADATKIIWYMTPVCQITDPSGQRLLAYGDNKTVAQFFSLAEAIVAYNNMSSGFFSETPGQIQMLVADYSLDEECADIARDCVLTTAYGLPTCTITRGRGTQPQSLATSMLTVAAGFELDITRLVLDGGSQKGYVANANGGILHAKYGSTIKLNDNSVLRNSSVGQGHDGGAVYLESTAALEMRSNATISDCAAARNGGGSYLVAGSTMLMVDDARIQGCEATQNGGAVYVGSGAELTVSNSQNDQPVIVGNRVVDGNGAGIYLAGEYSRLYLQGKPLFSEQPSVDESARTDANSKTGTVTNGGEEIAHIRQDIYVDYNSANATEHIRLTNSLRSNAGSIWVWMYSREHYLKDKQFAVIENGASVSDATLRVFRDAVDDVIAENQTGQYYTGVRGENEGHVYWGVIPTGQRKVILRKVANAGTGRYASLAGARFRIYDSSWKQRTNVEYESDASGVYFVGELPYGTYYVVETQFVGDYVPAGYAGYDVADPSTWLYYELHVGDPGEEVGEQDENGNAITFDARGTYVHGLLSRGGTVPEPAYTYDVALSPAAENNTYTVGQAGVTATLMRALENEAGSAFAFTNGVTWASSNASVVSVANSDGIANLTFGAVGTVTLSAYVAGSGEPVASVEVSVARPANYATSEHNGVERANIWFKANITKDGRAFDFKDIYWGFRSMVANPSIVVYDSDHGLLRFTETGVATIILTVTQDIWVDGVKYFEAGDIVAFECVGQEEGLTGEFSNVRRAASWGESGVWYKSYYITFTNTLATNKVQAVIVQMPASGNITKISGNVTGSVQNGIATIRCDNSGNGIEPLASCDAWLQIEGTDQSIGLNGV